MSPMPPSLAAVVAARTPATIRYRIRAEADDQGSAVWVAYAYQSGYVIDFESAGTWDEAAAWCDAHHRELV